MLILESSAMTAKRWFLLVSEPKNHNYDRIFNLINEVESISKDGFINMVKQQFNTQ